MSQRRSGAARPAAAPWCQHVLFCADGVHSLVDGESLRQDPAAAQDESAEEEEEEEKGGQRGRGRLALTPSARR